MLIVCYYYVIKVMEGLDVRKGDMTGYEKNESGEWIYRGNVYVINKKARMTLMKWMLGAAILKLICFVLAGCLNNDGMHRIWVALPYTLGGLCACLWMGKGLQLLDARGPLKQPDYQRLVQGTRGVIVFGGVCSMIAALGVVGLSWNDEWRFGVLQLVQTACDAAALYALSRHPWEKQKLQSTE